MDDRTKGIRLLIAGAIFLVAGLNMWYRGWFDWIVTAVIAGLVLLGGAACLAAGGFFLSQD